MRAVNTLLDVAGAAEHLNVTPRFIRELVAQKKVRYHKLGKLLRFRPEDLDAYLESTVVEPAKGIAPTAAPKVFSTPKRRRQSTTESTERTFASG